LKNFILPNIKDKETFKTFVLDLFCNIDEKQFDFVHRNQYAYYCNFDTIVFIIFLDEGLSAKQISKTLNQFGDDIDNEFKNSQSKKFYVLTNSIESCDYFEKLDNIKVEFWSWIKISIKSLSYQSLLNKYFNQLYTLNTNYEINSIESIGNNNILLQGINNSNINIVNPFNFQQFEHLLEKFISLKKSVDLIQKQNNEEIITLLKRIFDKLDPDYSEKWNSYSKKIKDNYLEGQVFDEKEVKLSNIYVEPYFKIFNTCFKSDDERINYKDDKGFVDLTYFLKEENYTINKFLVSEIKETIKNEDLTLSKLQLRKHPKITLLFGSPGQGKSSFSKRLAYDLINAIDNYKIVFIKLRDITATQDFINNPIKEIKNRLLNELNLNSEKLDFTETILILDGLDELWMQENMSFNNIDDICDKLIKESLNNIPYIVLTSRTGYIDLKKINNENILILHLKEFDLDLQIEWLNKYKLKRPDCWLKPKHLSDLIDESEKMKDIVELIKQPIILYFIANTSEEIISTKQRTQIYDNLFNQLIHRKYDKDPQNESGILDIHRKANINTEILRILIREIAFALFQNNNNYIDQKTLLNINFVKEYIAKIIGKEKEEIDGKKLRDALRGVMMSFHLAPNIEKAAKEENYAIEFLHDSLYEFLASEKIYYTFIDKFKPISQNEYKIDTWKSALDLMTELFAKKRIKKEMIDFIVEFINNEDATLKQNIFNRLMLFLPDLFENDFFSITNFNKIRPIDLSLNTFYGFAIFFSHSISTKYYLTDKIKDRIIFYLQLDYYYNLKLDSLFFDSFIWFTYYGYNVETSSYNWQNAKITNPSGYDLLFLSHPDNTRYLAYYKDSLSLKPNNFSEFFANIFNFYSKHIKGQLLLFHRKNGIFAQIDPISKNPFEFLSVLKTQYFDNKLIFNENYKGNNFIEFIISETKFIRCDFSILQFVETTMNESMFSDCNFSQCLFKNSTKNESKFKKCNLSESHWDNTNINETKFDDCNLSNVKMYSATINESKLDYCQFSGIQVTDSSMSSV